MGGGIEKGKKRKQKRTGREKKRREKKGLEKTASSRRESSSKSRTTFWFLNVVSIVLRAIQLLIEDPSLVSSFFCARIKMWPRLEITTENYRQESFDAGSTTCCKDTTEE